MSNVHNKHVLKSKQPRQSISKTTTHCRSKQPRSRCNEAIHWKWAMYRLMDTQYCYKSFCLPLRSFESPIFFLLSLAGELSVVSVWPWRSLSRKTVSLPMSLDLFLSSELKVVDDSTLERLIAESANDDGTVTERLPRKFELRWMALEL